MGVNDRMKVRGGWSRRRKIIVSVVTVVLLLAVAGAAYGWYAWSEIFRGKEAVTVPEDSALSPDELKGRVSVLLLGADQRGKEAYYNTDSIILATIDTQNKRISLLSIPRDTRVEDKNGKEVKINSIAGSDGPVALQQVVSNLTGLPVSGYILTNFEGFKAIIDALGGITIDVEKNMYYETGDKTDGIIDLKKGVQRLDGAKALQYARFRHDALADISRTARQQAVLKAVAKQMLQVGTIPKIPTLVPKLHDAVESNLSLGDMLKLTQVVVGFNQSNMISQTLPGEFLTLNGVSYWKVDPEKVKQTVKNLLMGITTDDVIQYDGTSGATGGSGTSGSPAVGEPSGGENAGQNGTAAGTAGSAGSTSGSSSENNAGSGTLPAGSSLPATPNAPAGNDGSQVTPPDQGGGGVNPAEPDNGGSPAESPLPGTSTQGDGQTNPK